MRAENAASMKQMLKGVAVGAFATSLISCAALPTTTKFDVTTEPVGAAISILSESGGETLLGNSPLAISDEVLSRQDRILRVLVTKSGYVKEHVMVDTLAAKSRGKIHINLTPMANWTEAYQDKNAQKYLEDVASLAAEIQGATVRSDFVKAERIARSMVTRYPKLAAGWSLIGNVFYLQKRMADALDAYNKALALDPENQDTKNVVERIKTSGF